MNSRCLHRRDERGSAVVVVITLLAIILIYIAGNARTLQHLDREVKLIERKQVRRIASPANTNSVQRSESLPVRTASPPFRNP